MEGFFLSVQKQPFAEPLQNSCSQNFRNIHRKKLVMESLSNKAAVQKVCNFIKNKLQHRCFPVNNYCEIFKISFLYIVYRTPLVAAPVSSCYEK